MKIKLVLIVLNLPPLLFVLSPDSKMVKNIKIRWKLTKLWKIFLGAFKNKIDTNYGSEIWNYGSKNYGKEIPFLPYFTCLWWLADFLSLGALQNCYFLFGYAVRSGQVRSGQVGSGQFGLGQALSGSKVVLAPRKLFIFVGGIL